jgi:hypothetical protein
MSSKSVLDVILALDAAACTYEHANVCYLIFAALDKAGLARWPSGEMKNISYISDEVLVQALEEYRP